MALLYEEAVTNLGPVAYWRLGEASGNFIDLVSSRALSANGSVTRDVKGGIICGIDADDGAVDIPNDSTPGTDYLEGSDWLDLEFQGQVPYTVIAWIRRDPVTSAPNSVVNKYDYLSLEDQRGWHIYSQYDGSAVRFGTSRWYGGTNTHGVASGYDYGTGWHMAVARYNGDVLSLFVDGVVQNSITANTNLPATSQPFRVGILYQQDASEFGDGHHGGVDEVSIFDKALTDDEIENLYIIAAVCGIPFLRMNRRSSARSSGRHDPSVQDSIRNPGSGVFV